jgi:hypothetical protein
MYVGVAVKFIFIASASESAWNISSNMSHISLNQNSQAYNSMYVKHIQ